ncbi:MAG: hypothetical protein AVDCRST_MAG34-2250, partial [uncultured Nocardioidaceae bacterium]
ATPRRARRRERRGSPRAATSRLDRIRRGSRARSRPRRRLRPRRARAPHQAVAPPGECRHGGPRRHGPTAGAGCAAARGRGLPHLSRALVEVAGPPEAVAGRRGLRHPLRRADRRRAVRRHRHRSAEPLRLRATDAGSARAADDDPSGPLGAGAAAAPRHSAGSHRGAAEPLRRGGRCGRSGVAERGGAELRLGPGQATAVRPRRERSSGDRAVPRGAHAAGAGVRLGAAGQRRPDL